MCLPAGTALRGWIVPFGDLGVECPVHGTLAAQIAVWDDSRSDERSFAPDTPAALDPHLLQELFPPKLAADDRSGTDEHAQSPNGDSLARGLARVSLLGLTDLRPSLPDAGVAHFGQVALDDLVAVAPLTGQGLGHRRRR